jgi:MFS family permease
MFLVLRAQNIGIKAAHAPLLGLVFNVVYTAAAWPFGHLSDRYSKPAVAAAGYTIFAVTYLVFAFAPSRGAIWAAMAFYGLFYALTDPVLRALVAQTVPAQVRGRGFGIFFFATSLGALLSSIMTGELWTHYGPALPLRISAYLGIVAATMLVMLAAFQKTRRRSPSF